MKGFRALHLLKTSVGATWALRQIRELVRLGVDVHVALPDGPLVHSYREVGASVHLSNVDFPVHSPKRFASTIATMQKLVTTVSPDLIHSHFVGTTLTMRLALGRSHPLPRIFQVPGPLHLEHSLFRWGELATAGPNDYWIGSCRWTCNRYIRAGIPKSRVFLSYYGIDVEQLTPEVSGKLRDQLGLTPETRVVGMVAYMYAPKLHLGQRRGLKGHEDLIDAVSIVRRSDPNVVCVMVGGAWAGKVWYEERLKRYAASHCPGGIIFLGTRKDVAELYPDIDVAVHPSHSENVGGAVESLMFARPTIATRVGGFPDLVRDGETGWLVPAKDAASLAAAIRQALEDIPFASRLATHGQRVAREMFDVRRNAREVLAAYAAVSGKVGLSGRASWAPDTADASAKTEEAW